MCPTRIYINQILVRKQRLRRREQSKRLGLSVRTTRDGKTPCGLPKAFSYRLFLSRCVLCVFWTVVIQRVKAWQNTGQHPGSHSPKVADLEHVYVTTGTYLQVLINGHSQLLIKPAAVTIHRRLPSLKLARADLKTLCLTIDLS